MKTNIARMSGAPYHFLNLGPPDNQERIKGNKNRKEKMLGTRFGKIFSVYSHTKGHASLDEASGGEQ